ncbi:MAG: Clp protease N-terminal domain-containing protein [Candidatus Angelobacter sp.]
MFAVWEARQAGSAYVEPGHLLLSLTHDINNKANQLFLLTTHAENFRKQVKLHSSAKSTSSVDLPLSNASKHILAYTAEEADRLTSKPIGTEHLLLGLLREKNSDVPAALAAAGIDLHSARNRIREDRGLPILDSETLPILYSETEDKDIPLKSLRPFAVFVLLILVLLLSYVIFRLVFR